MRYLIFAVFRVCTNAYLMVTNQRYISRPFAKKTVVESAILSFSIFSFFQHFYLKIIDSLSDVVELYKKFEDLFKQMVVFS